MEIEYLGPLEDEQSAVEYLGPLDSQPHGYTGTWDERNHMQRTYDAGIELAKSIPRGMAATGEMLGRAYHATGLPTIGQYSSDEAVDNAKEAYLNVSKKFPLTDVPGFEQTVGQGGESTVQSLGGMAMGIPLYVATGPLGGLASTGAIFSLAEYDQFKSDMIESAKSNGATADQLQKIRDSFSPEGFISASAEGGIEAATDWAGLKIFGILGNTVSAPVKRGLLNTLKRYGFDTLKMGSVEIPGEMATSAIQSSMRKQAGVKGVMSPWDSAKSIIGPSVVQTVLTAGLGSGARSIKNRWDAMDQRERDAAAAALREASRSKKVDEAQQAKALLNILNTVGQQKWDQAEAQAAKMDDAIHAEARQEDAASKLRERLMREQADSYSGNQILQNLASMNDKQLLEWWDATERDSRAQRDAPNAEARSDINGQKLKEKLTGIERLSREIFGDDQVQALPKPDAIYQQPQEGQVYTPQQVDAINRYRDENTNRPQALPRPSTIYAEAGTDQITTREQIEARRRYQEQAQQAPAALPKPEVIYLGPLNTPAREQSTPEQPQKQQNIPSQEQPRQGEQPRPDAAVSQEAAGVSSGFKNKEQIAADDHANVTEGLTNKPGLSKSSLAPSVGTAKTSDVEDISDASTTSNEFKQFMSDYGMTLDGTREVVKAQRSGESITLQEAQDRGDAAEARRESERREYFSAEAVTASSEKAAPAIDLAQIEESAIIAFPDMMESEGGLLPLTGFTPTEQNSLRRAGIVRTATTSIGNTYEGVDAEYLWQRRKEMQSANRANRLKASSEKVDNQSVTSSQGPGEKTTEATPKPDGGIINAYLSAEENNNIGVPEGWYIHGIGDSKQFKTIDEKLNHNVVQLTNKWDWADWSRDGRTYAVKPKKNANVFDFTDQYSNDMDKIVDVAVKQLEDESPQIDLLRDAIEGAKGEPLDEFNLEESIRESFSPEDIGNSAGAFDNPDFVQWLFDNFDVDMVKTPDGAVILQHPERFDIIHLNKHIKSNPNQPRPSEMGGKPKFKLSPKPLTIDQVQQAPTVEPAANGEQKGQPEPKAVTNDAGSGKKANGWVWIKEQQLPFTSWREITRGKNKGKIAVNVRGREVIVDKSKVEVWPEDNAATQKTDQPAESVRAETDGATLDSGPTSEKTGTNGDTTLYSGLAFLEPFINRGAAAAKAKASDIPRISQQQKAKLKRVTSESIPDMTEKLRSILKGVTDSKAFDAHAAGQLWKEAVIRIETEANSLVGRNLSKMEKAEAALSISDRQWAHRNFKQVYEAEGSAGMPTAKLKAYADAWTEVHNDLGRIAEDLGVMVADDRFEGGRRPFTRSLPNFFPRSFTKEARDAVKRGRGSVFEAMVQAGIERGVDVKGLIEANTTVDDMRRFGHMENPRIGELPDTVTTKNGETVKILQSNPFDMIASYINGAAHRLAIIRELGQDEAQSIAEEVSTALKSDGLHTEGRMVDDTWAVLNGNLSREERRRLEERGLLGIVRPLESIARLAMLSTATVSQISGWVPMAARGGMWNNVKAMAEVAGEKAGRRIGLDLKSTAELDLVRNMGGWAKDVLGHTYETEDLEGFADFIAKKGLSATGFSASNRVLNQAASLTALNSFIDGMAYLRNPKDSALSRLWGKDAQSIRNQLKSNYDFTDSEIDRMIGNGIDYSDAQAIADKAATDPKMQRAYLDMAQAVQRMVGKTNLYRESILNRPPWMNKRGARMFMTFLSYSRAMGRTLGYSMTEAKRGNLRPIVTLLAGGAVAGGVVDELKKLLFKKKDEPIEDSWDLFKRLIDYELEAATFGLWGVVAQDALWSYRLNDVSIDIPLVEWWFRNVRGVVKSIDKGDPGEIYKELARSTPIIKAIDAQFEGPLYSGKSGTSRRSTSSRKTSHRKTSRRKTSRRRTSR